MTFWKWSKTAASNATADSSINYAEGMAPSGLNDSGRAVMAAAAKYRDDIAGAIVTGGTSTAYTVASNQVFDSLAHLDGAMIAFTPHVTCGATVTLNVDGLGAKPLRFAPTLLAAFPNVELPAATLIQGTPYSVTYNNTDGAFYLHGFMNLPFVVPVGGMVDYFGTSSPSSNFVFPYGQAISRTTYSVLFGLLGTTFGTGDGSTTFNVPDLRGRVIAGKDDMGGSAAGRLSSTLTGTTLGAAGGSETQTLTLAQLPTGITATGSGSVTVTSNNYTASSTDSASGSAQAGGSQVSVPGSPGGTYAKLVSNGTATGVTTTSNNTSGNSHPIVQPTIISNKLLRII
jgi:microcystin-dependent protein